MNGHFVDKFTFYESSYKKKVVQLLAMPIYIAEKGNELQRKPLLYGSRDNYGISF